MEHRFCVWNTDFAYETQILLWNNGFRVWSTDFACEPHMCVLRQYEEKFAILILHRVMHVWEKRATSAVVARMQFQSSNKFFIFFFYYIWNPHFLLPLPNAGIKWRVSFAFVVFFLHFSSIGSEQEREHRQDNHLQKIHMCLEMFFFSFWINRKAFFSPGGVGPTRLALAESREKVTNFHSSENEASSSGIVVVGVFAIHIHIHTQHFATIKGDRNWRRPSSYGKASSSCEFLVFESEKSNSLL